jgi:hypothetical protein
MHFGSVAAALALYAQVASVACGPLRPRAFLRDASFALAKRRSGTAAGSCFATDVQETNTHTGSRNIGYSGIGLR